MLSLKDNKSVISNTYGISSLDTTIEINLSFVPISADNFRVQFHWYFELQKAIKVILTNPIRLRFSLRLNIKGEQNCFCVIGKLL